MTVSTTSPHPTANKTPVWLDCDPGHDDAFAIILAAEHPTLNLLGISTVHGNAPISRVTHNALSILISISRTSVPVYTGSSKPFMRPAVHAPEIHGASGIDGTDLLPPVTVSKSSSAKNAILAMRDALMSTAPQTALLVATGTLTNIALLLATFPEVAEHIKTLSIMGGAFGTRPDAAGNISPCAEFNIFCDPEAAHSVLSNPVLSGKVVLVPLDLTHTVLATKNVQERLLGDGTSKLRRMLVELLMFFAGTYERVFNITDGPPLHDPLAVAVGLDLGWEWEEVGIRVECAGEEVGRTVKIAAKEERRDTNLGGHGKIEACVVRIPTKVNVDAFWGLILGVVEGADGRYTWE